MAYVGYYQDFSDNTLVASTESNFVAVYDLSNIPSAQWSDIRSDGGNLYVTDGSNVRYPAYVDWINTGTEEGNIWFKMPTISSSSDTEIRIHIDDSAVTAPSDSSTYGRNNVFSDYDVFLSMQETSGNLIDLTGNGNDCSLSSGTQGVTGQNGNAIEVTGTSSSYGTISHDTDLNSNNNNKSWGIWFNSDDAINSSGILRTLHSKGRYNTSGSEEWLCLRGGSTYNGIFFRMRTSSSGAFDCFPSTDYTTLVGDGNWHHVVSTFDTSDIRLNFDGAEIATRVCTLTINSTSDLYLGRQEGNTGWMFDGKIDNFFIRDDVLSEDYVSTMYENQNNPDTFWTGAGSFVSGPLPVVNKSEIYIID